MNAAVLVQARTGSTRLPGKVLRQLGNVSMLTHVVRRVSQTVLPVFVLPPSSDMAPAAPLALECSRHGMVLPHEPFLGAEEDVLGRFAHFAATDPRVADVDVFVRITADCPFIDPTQVRMAARMVDSADHPLAMAHNARDLPVDGWDVEAFTRLLLEEAHHMADTAYEREHVCSWMKKHGQVYTFRRREHVWPLEGNRRGQYRWTVDTTDDFEWARRVHATLNFPWPPRPTTEEMLQLMHDKPLLRRYSL